MISLRPVFFFALFLLSACSTSNQKKVTVAVAANMQYAMEEIVSKFEEIHGIDIEVASGSSGVLTTQIRQGAPYDVFVSANMKYPNSLFEEGKAMSIPKPYAYGSLILWSQKKDIDLAGGLSSLFNHNISKCAIANPETAPYGIAAIQSLKKASFLDSLQDKIIYGESISQVNQYILSKTVDVGITSKSVLSSRNVKDVEMFVEIDRTAYTQISQGIVLLKYGVDNNAKNAQLFYDFMFSEQVQSILVEFGYIVD